MICIFRPLGSIALCTERLKVIDPIASALVDRLDVVLIQMPRRTAANAAVSTNINQCLPFLFAVCTLALGNLHTLTTD